MTSLKRLSAFVVVGSMLLGIASSHYVEATTDPDVQICYPHHNRVIRNGVSHFEGPIVEVPQSASLDYKAQGGIELATSVSLPACCSFTVLSNGNIVQGLID